MIRFKVRYCKVHMARFVSRDLSPAVQRRVARYIDECPDCYREYMRHREFNQRLAQSLPGLGAPSQAKLGCMWAALQSEMIAPAKPTSGLRDFARRGSLPFSYGLVALALCLTLLLPMALGYGASARSAVLPPAPQVVSLARTPAPGITGAAAAIAATQPPALSSAPRLGDTPAPLAQ